MNSEIFVWHWHIEILLGLTLVQMLYLHIIGAFVSENKTKKINPKEVISFTSGILLILVCTVSPLHHIADNYLFSAHMLQHVFLTLVAPPLLILGIPGRIIDNLIKSKIQIFIFKRLLHPITIFFIFNLVFSIWHMPILYNLSVNNHSVHIFEHFTFISSAFAMWWPIFNKSKNLPRISFPAQMIYIFLLSVAQIIVFGIITFSNSPIYEFYANAPKLWNLTPLIDQQIGGVIMKVGSAILFMTIILKRFFDWYQNEQRNSHFK